MRTALEVLAAYGIDTVIDAADGYTPTPAISHAILNYNRGRRGGDAGGIVITPSHNPPHGGPAIPKLLAARCRAPGMDPEPLSGGGN